MLPLLLLATVVLGLLERHRVIDPERPDDFAARAPLQMKLGASALVAAADNLHAKFTAKTVT
jgi:hypothetical protein